MKEIRLIVGLANPGKEYEQTRHNVGAWYVAQLARQEGVLLKEDKKMYGLTGRIQFCGQDVRLLVPTTYMNRSGQAVAAMASFYRIAPEEILIAHDELDLPPGVGRFKQGGGHGGHNGLRDVIAALGQNKNFYRLRIGIGHPGHKNQVADFVLKKAPKTEYDAATSVVDEAVRATELGFQSDMVKAMTRLHSFKAL
jgi:PTH1 family peptidyl-tRNA hydrolase